MRPDAAIQSAIYSLSFFKVELLIRSLSLPVLYRAPQAIKSELETCDLKPETLSRTIFEQFRPIASGVGPREPRIRSEYSLRPCSNQ